MKQAGAELGQAQSKLGLIQIEIELSIGFTISSVRSCEMGLILFSFNPATRLTTWYSNKLGLS